MGLFFLEDILQEGASNVCRPWVNWIELWVVYISTPDTNTSVVNCPQIRAHECVFIIQYPFSFSESRDDIRYINATYLVAKTWQSTRGLAIALCILVAVAKYKENGCIISTIVSMLAFFATIYGIQVSPPPLGSVACVLECIWRQRMCAYCLSPFSFENCAIQIRGFCNCVATGQRKHVFLTTKSD